MRLLLVTWACDLDDVSEPAVTARWVTELARDHEVTLFSVSKPERFGSVREQFPQLDVIEWRDVRVPAALSRFRAVVKPGYLRYYPLARHFLRELLRTGSFDVVHHLTPFAWRYPSPAGGLGVPLVRGPVAGGLATPAGLSGPTAGWAAAARLLRRTDGWRARHDPILRAAYRATDHLLLAAPYVRDYVAPLPLNATSVECELGLVEVPRLAPRFPTGASTVQLLFVGRLVATKGARLAIEAMARSVARDHLRLTIVGDGPERAACIETARRTGLLSQVTFAGWCKREAVTDHYRRADIFLFPSYREPTGGVLLEAMAHGLPVITCAYGGPDDLVGSDCGIKVPPVAEPDFVDALAQAIDRLAADSRLRAATGGASLRRATDFAWQAKRKRLAAIYAAVARREAIPAEEGADGCHHHSSA